MSLALLFELAKAFLICGLLSFGGGYAMIPIVEREIIAAGGWLSVTTFTEVIAVAEMTPGPIAVNTATFVGYQIGGLPGAVVGTSAVLAVPALISGTLAVLTTKYGHLGPVNLVLCGLRPAACALLTAAAVTVARGASYDWRALAIGGLAALALWRRVNPLLVIGGSAALGLLLY